MANKILLVEKENLEDLTVIWLDEYSQDMDTKTRLRCFINFLKIFTELDSCLQYIQSIPDEHIFVIVSGQLSSSLIPFIHELPQILHIYIFCQHPEKYSLLKSSGIFTDQESLYHQLSKDVNHFHATRLSTISYLTEKSLRDITKEIGAFFWFQLFITALIDMPPSNEAKQDFLQFARTNYADNDLELRRIDDFDRTYDASKALKWYSSNSFVYRLLNKAIRTENTDLLFACRFFIVDLHRQLESLHKSYMERIRSCHPDEFKVYRGQQMTADDFAKLNANVGKLISINSFLSTSTNQQVALIFAGDEAADSTMKSVLFQIKINVNGTSNTYQHPFADISEYSQFKEEQEILFSLAAMFRIESITKELDSIWMVNLVLIESTTETEEMQQLQSYLGGHSDKPTTMADLIYLLFLMGDYDRTISFGRKLISEVSDNWALIVRCYNFMGQAYVNHPKLALESFENALELQLRYNPTGFTELATLYTGLGWAYHRLGSDTHLVVHYYEKALEMCTTFSDESQMNWCLIATILNNMVMATSYSDLDLDLEKEKLVLDIRLKHLPLSHPLVAKTHMTLAQVYMARGEFEEALVHYDEALRIQLKYLPSCHKYIADTYIYLASLHLDKGKYEDLQLQKEASKISYNKSLELNYQALDILLSGETSSSTNYHSIASVHNNCGIVYIRIGRLDKALNCFNMASNIGLQHLLDNHDLHSILLQNKGKVFTLQGNMKKGMEYYKLGMKFYDQIGSSAHTTIRMAPLYFNLGEWYELSEKSDLAIAYYERALQTGAQIYKSNHPVFLQYKKALENAKSTVTAKMLVEQVSWL